MRRVVALIVALAVAVSAGAALAADALPFTLDKQSAEWCAFCWDEHAVNASGRVDTGGGRVHVQVNECRYPGWHDITSTLPDATGRWNVGFSPPSSTSLVRVVWRDRRSATVRLRVRVAVVVTQDIRHPGRFEISVGGPSVVGRRVTLDRFVDGTWRAFRSVRLTRGGGGYSAANVRLSLPAGQAIRARFDPRAKCYEAGVSPVLVVKRVG